MPFLFGGPIGTCARSENAKDEFSVSQRAQFAFIPIGIPATTPCENIRPKKSNKQMREEKRLAVDATIVVVPAEQFLSMRYGSNACAHQQLPVRIFVFLFSVARTQYWVRFCQLLANERCGTHGRKSFLAYFVLL